MQTFSMSVVGLTDPPPLDETNVTVLGHIADSEIKGYVINGGLSGGQPSIALIIPVDPQALLRVLQTALDMDGDMPLPAILVETSLGAFLTAAQIAHTMAEVHFGWERPA